MQANPSDARPHCRPGLWVQINPGVESRRHVDHGVVQRKDHPGMLAVVLASIEPVVLCDAHSPILGAASETLVGSNRFCEVIAEGAGRSDLLKDRLQGSEWTAGCLGVVLHQEVAEPHQFHIVGPVRLSWADVCAEVPEQAAGMSD